MTRKGITISEKILLNSHKFCRWFFYPFMENIKRISMKATLLVLFLYFSITVIAQNNTETSAIMLSFNGKGEYFRNSKRNNIEFPQTFFNNDVIKISNGNAILLLGNGKEVVLKQGDSFEVPTITDNNLLSVDPKLFRNYGIQSYKNTMFKLRSEEIKLLISPISSKLIDKSNAYIYWKSDKKEKLKIKFRFYELLTDELVDSITIEDKNELHLGKINLEKGKEYYWLYTLDGCENEQMGAISVVSEDFSESLPKFKTKSKTEIIKAYNYYLSNEYIFEACHIIKKATQQFPKDSLFLFLQKNAKNCKL